MGGVEENEENRRKPRCNNNFTKRSKIRYRRMCNDFRGKVFFPSVGFGRLFVGNCAHCCLSCHFVWDFYKGYLECDNSAVSLLFPYYLQIEAK